jgi:hypothetical protein
MPEKRVHELTPGDHLSIEFMDGDVECKILRPAGPSLDLFGRTMWKVWAKRLDTDQEGWLTYGPHVDITTWRPV